VSITCSFFQVQMAFRIDAQLPELEHLAVGLLGQAAVFGRGAAQHRFDALGQKPLRKRFADEIVGAHFEAEQYINLLFLRGQEDYRQIGFLPQLAQCFHAVHSRHLDIKDGEIRRPGFKTVER
jgi:hypothetical protein